MYTSKTLSIKQQKDAITITYKENTSMEYLIHFLTTSKIKHELKGNTITISCDSSETLIEFHKKHKHILSHKSVCSSFYDISTQLIWLHKHKFVVDHMYRKDIIVLNEGIFLYVGLHHIVSLDESSVTIPDNIYGFGVLLIKLQFNKDITKDKYVMKKVIEPIYYTSLYWTLLRCLDKTPENRVLLYI